MIVLQLILYFCKEFVLDDTYRIISSSLAGLFMFTLELRRRGSVSSMFMFSLFIIVEITLLQSLITSGGLQPSVALLVVLPGTVLPTLWLAVPTIYRKRRRRYV